MKGLVPHVAQSIRGHALLRRGQAVLLAVSGGMDSMVLLRVLHQMAPANQWRLALAHLNHGLRGSDSDGDEAWVVQVAKGLGLTCVTERADTRRHAAAHKLSIEMAARELRHEFLARTARHLRAEAIALAHHADDQVELFFLRLLRGAGGSGLAGMKWTGPSPADTRIRLIRPLLDQRKEALAAFAAEQGIACREDATNRDPDILRNRLRGELLPLMARRYGRGLVKTILRVMTLVGDDADFSGQAARRWLLAARPAAFEKLHVAVQRQCVRRQLAALGVVDEFDLVERLRLHPEDAVMIEPGITVIRKPDGRVYREKVFTKTFHGGQQVMDLSAAAGNLTFDGLRIRWQVCGRRGRSYRPFESRSDRECFDADKIGGRVVLRHWRRGDRFQPSGMASAVKLQDLFTNHKVPGAERHARVIAATAAGELFWVEGLRIAERFKLDNRTRKCLKWEWRRR